MALGHSIGAYSLNYFPYVLSYPLLRTALSKPLFRYDGLMMVGTEDEDEADSEPGRGNALILGMMLDEGIDSKAQSASAGEPLVSN